MAIDSADKRRGALTGRTGVVLPNPDGSIGVGDRAQVSGVYRLFTSETSASTGFLFPDVYHVVVKVSLQAKDGSGTLAYWFGKDYHPEGEFYATNPTVYPLLAQDPRVQRGVRIYDAVRYDMNVSLFSKVDIENRGRTFASVLDDYELHGAQVEVRRYHKPHGIPVSDADEANLRAKSFEVIGAGYDDGNGVCTLQCRDVWFKDKELNRTLAMRVEDNSDARWDGEYGTIVFGESSTSGQGVLVDAPIFKSFVESGTPEIWLYAGWSYNDGTHGVKELDRLLVRNKNKSTNKNEWVEIDAELDPQAALLGEAQATGATDPPNYPRDLSYYKRGRVFEIAGDGSLVSAVRAKMMVPQYDRCADVIAGQYLWNNNNPDFLSSPDGDFSVEFWAKFDLLHDGTKKRVVVQQGDASEGTLEWAVYFDTTNATLKFAISHAGSAFNNVLSSPSNITSGTWNHYVFSYDSVSNELRGWLDGSAFTPVATTGNVTRLGGTFSVASRGTTYENFDGKIKSLRVYKFAFITANVTDLYGSGTPIVYDGLVNEYRVHLRCNYDLSEPEGSRYDQHGSAHLTPGTVNTLIPQDIAYAYSNRSLSFTNAFGSPTLRIFEVETLDSGAGLSPTGGALRTVARDIKGLSTSITDEYFVFEPLLLADGVKYLFELDFDNTRTNTYFPLVTWNSQVGSDHYYFPKRQDDAAWQLTEDNRLDLQVYGIGRSTLALSTEEHSEMGTVTMLDLAGKAVALHAGQSYQEIKGDLEFKAGVKGIKDDAGGTYTGVTNAVIKNPADIVRFTLMNNDFGLSLDSTRVDTAALSAVRSLLAPLGLYMQIAINKSISADEFVREVARQSRTVFYKNRLGKLLLHFPTPAPPAADMTARLCEGDLGGEMIVLADADADYSDVVNEFTQYYAPDNLNQPDSPNVLRQSFQEKLAGKLVTNGEESTTGDAYHTALCAASEGLFGRREMTSPLNFYDNGASAGAVQLYYCARYTTLARRVQVRVPARDYYDTLDLFSTVRAAHTGLRSAAGTAAETATHDDGEGCRYYDEMLPTRVYSGGSASGIIVEVVEEGPWITYTIETAPNF